MPVADPEKAARKERLAALLSDPAETMDTIFAHIANGGSLIQLCETWDVRFSDISKWIESDENRKKAHQAAVLARAEWSDEMLLAEIRAVARFDIRKLYNEDGSLRSISELDAETARMVQSAEVDELWANRTDGPGKEQVGTTKKIKLWDKLKALEMAMKNRRLLNDKPDNEINIKLEDLVGRSMEPPPQTAPAVQAPATPSPAPAAPVNSAAGQPAGDACPVPVSTPAPAAETQPAPASPEKTAP